MCIFASVFEWVTVHVSVFASMVVDMNEERGPNSLLGGGTRARKCGLRPIYEAGGLRVIEG